jgi:hypothetical protein
MRKFQVGDKVKWYEIDDCPMWDFKELYARVKKGEWAEGFVTRVDADNTFLVDGWRWPQPGHELACYGVPGYLELVEAAPEPKLQFQVRKAWNGKLLIWNKDSCSCSSESSESSFPKNCHSAVEALCAKLNEAVLIPKFQARKAWNGRLLIWNQYSCLPESSFPESCRPELESICAKLNKKEGTP